jgi:hypothetical protein
MLIASLAPDVGVALAAVNAVVVALREAEEVEGQLFSRLSKLTEPRPVASS